MGIHGNEPRNKKSAARNTEPAADERTKYSDFKFVRIELSEEEKAEFRGLLRSGDEPELDLDDLVSKGYALSLSLDRDGKTVLVTLKQLYVLGENTRGILTARHGSARGALACLAYKLQVIIGNRFWQEAEMARGGEYDDGLG